MRVTPGIEAFVRDHADQFRGTKIALLGHAASVTPDLAHSLDALLAAGMQVVGVIGPEHGFRGGHQAGSSAPSGVDAGTGVPVIDAYEQPMADALRAAGADVVVADIQHVGARFYTYESSLHDLIAAAAEAGTRVIVCDRPNPVTGRVVAGPVLEPGFASFVGRASVPVRHGMTVGELARYFAALHGASGLVEVVPMTGWRRDAWYDRCGLPWVPPSPNLPDLDAVACYPGTCLMEGTSLSVGRGTTIPFRFIGAPWADARLGTRLRSLDLPGVAFRSAEVIPRFDVYAGQTVSGVQLHITERDAFDPLRTAVEIISAALALWPEQATFRAGHFDRLAGTGRLREALEAGADPAEIVCDWAREVQAFAEVRAGHLMYGEGSG
jgi:uncharacterized protein YbbC (DUF1343 family)